VAVPVNTASRLAPGAVRPVSHLAGGGPAEEAAAVADLAAAGLLMWVVNGVIVAERPLLPELRSAGSVLDVYQRAELMPRPLPEPAVADAVGALSVPLWVDIPTGVVRPVTPAAGHDVVAELLARGGAVRQGHDTGWACDACGGVWRGVERGARCTVANCPGSASIPAYATDLTDAVLVLHRHPGWPLRRCRVCGQTAICDTDIHSWCAAAS
jgi:hypothetical protein